MDHWLPDLRFSPHGADKDLHLAYTAVVVQKEYFLRPDQGQTDSWRQTLRKIYGAITNGFARYRFPYPFTPRMHHKFLVRVGEPDNGLVPAAVLRGC